MFADPNFVLTLKNLTFQNNVFIGGDQIVEF